MSLNTIVPLRTLLLRTSGPPTAVSNLTASSCVPTGWKVDVGEDLHAQSDLHLRGNCDRWDSLVLERSIVCVSGFSEDHLG